MAKKRKTRKKEGASVVRTRQDEELEKIRSLLTSDERYVKHYKIGMFNIVQSDKRLTFSRRWPRVFIKMPFKEIRRIEYFTKIDWGSLFKTLVYFGIAVFLMLRPKLLWESFIGYYWPFVTELLALSKPFNYVVVSYGLMFLFYLLGIVAAVKFISWLIGRLTVESRRRIEPLEMICRFTDDVQALMTEIEPKIKKRQ
ncbi:hypothetical protein GF351_00675 [Candidatus Woesearchaeota archaeon]|nr:hypothetical protein [Candidatus Woesearchaeota archaeon]